MKLPHAFLAALLATAAPAQAAEITRLNTGHDVVMKGIIAAGDADKLDYAIAYTIMPQVKANPNAPRSVWIWLSSPGGSIFEAAKMIEVVRRWTQDWGVTVNTAVNDGQTCASACVLVFGAGVQNKWVLGNAFIGVHRGAANKRDANGQITSELDPNSVVADSASLDMMRILSGQGAPASMIKRLLDTPNNDVSVVPYTELSEWGVHIRPAVQ